MQRPAPPQQRLPHCSRRRCNGLRHSSVTGGVARRPPEQASPHNNSRDRQRTAVQCRAGLLQRLLPSQALQLQQLEPRALYLADSLAQGLLLPLVAGWLTLQLIRSVADAGRQWCDRNPDAPFSLEMLGLLPSALETPSRLAVTFLVSTRVLRNLAGMLQGFVDTFRPQWDAYVDQLVAWIIAALGPLDRGLIRVYTVAAVLLITRALIKWKSAVLDSFLRHAHALQESNMSLGLAQQQQQQQQRKAADAAWAASAAQAASSAAGPGPEGLRSGSCTGELVKEGGVLQVAMHGPRRPASAMASADSNADSDTDSSGDEGDEPSALAAALSSRAAAVGASGGSGAVPGFVAASAAVGASGGSRSLRRSGSSKSGRKSSKGGWDSKSADDMERLLLPLDSIASWLAWLLAGLCIVQTLGINIQPLLAVGGASSIIIGLATQTLLTNAVMGVSIFLSRPFVAGDAVTVQGIGNIIISGVVERVTPMRTMLRTDDDVLVCVPNKTVADMVIYNKSRRSKRKGGLGRRKSSRLVKFKVKLPHKELQQLEPLQDALKKQLRRPGVSQQSVDVALSKFTDSGAEVLLQCVLLVAADDPIAQCLLTDVAMTAKQFGGIVVSLL